MINLLLHKGIENTVTMRPPDSVPLYQTHYPQGYLLPPWSPSSLPQGYTPFLLSSCLAIHSLPNIFSSRICRALGHLFFLSLQILFHPSSYFVPLEADINELHKSGFIDIWPQYDFSQQEAPAGYHSREGKRSWSIYSISSLPTKQKFGRGFVLLKDKFRERKQIVVSSNLGGEENGE